MNDKKILIFGNGWIGNRLKEYFGEKATIYSEHIDLDTVIPESLYFDIWINTIAKTNIDWCENNKYEALFINTLLAHRLAVSAKHHNKKYIFISSACIFESENTFQEYAQAKEYAKFITEDELPNPQCWYSETKVIAEKLIFEANLDSLVIRPRLPISAIPHPRNTLDKLMKYSLINDNHESVTVIEDMIPALDVLIQKNAKGIYHMVNEGTISPSELASAMGHTFETVSKSEQDKRLANEGRAKRVTGYIGSNFFMLPDIRKRGFEVANQWKINKQKESSQ